MKETLSKPEWVLMEALWSRNPMFLSEIMEATKTSVDWNSSSYLTYLKRMTDKGLIGYRTVSGNRCYSPLMQRRDCIENESNYILSKLTEDSTRLLLASMIQKSGLSEKDRDDLQELISMLDGGEGKETEHENP
jgi:BlaI family transcriptional regulator, penicillinase repressor